MGFFDALSRAFTLPSSFNSIGDIFGGGGGGSSGGVPTLPALSAPSAPALPAAPSLPQMPSILAAPPVAQQSALMPSPVSPMVKQAGQNSLLAALSRNGRASTILTSRKKRQNNNSAPNFDTYSSPTL